MAFYENIMKQVKDLDIGLVVLSAGVCHEGIIDKQNPADQQAMLDINSYQVGAMM